jgi:hypothetical protein
MASFTSSLTFTKTTSHESGRSWVSYITHEMRWVELTACRSLSICLHAYDICVCVHLDVGLFDCPKGSSCGTYRGPLVLVSMISMITIVACHTHVCSSGRSAPVMHAPRESYSSTRTRDPLGLLALRRGTRPNSMQSLPRVQTSLSSLRTNTSESSGTLSAVSAGTQDASPSLPYTSDWPLSHIQAPPALLSLRCITNNPTSPSAFSFIHSFGSAPGTLASASFPHIGISLVSAASTRSQASQYSAGHHAKKSSLVTGFALGAPYPSGPAYATRHSPLATCITQ